MKIEQLLCKENKSDIWYIDPILSTIFEFSTFQDLKTFNTVCKKWNQLTNPVIYRRISLSSCNYTNQPFLPIFQNPNLTKSPKSVAEIKEFIVNNSKHATFIKSLEFSEKSKPRITIEFFQTFKYLTKLMIHHVDISQDQFICMIKPLNKLEELDLYMVSIREIIKKRPYKESIQLPQTLSKLSICSLNLVGNPALFVQTMNSHSSLKEFIFNSGDESSFFTPFFTRYPSLETLKYRSTSSNFEYSRYLVNILEYNPQLLKLDLHLRCYNYSLASSIRKHLISLKELNFYDPYINPLGDLWTSNTLSIPIKIKKLSITCSELKFSCLNSIFKECSELDECILIIGKIVTSSESFSFNTEISNKIKKLKIQTKTLEESSLNDILMNCKYLAELDIVFPEQWKDYFEVISQRCPSLERLILHPLPNPYIKEVVKSFENYHCLKFLSCNLSFKNTLTSLILDKFNYELMNPKHIEHYPKLKFIKFSNQRRFVYKREIQMTYMYTSEKYNLEPNYVINHCHSYKIRKSNYTDFTYDIEMYKL